MDMLEKKSISTKRSLTYTYYTSTPIKGNKSSSQPPALLFIHGFPDSAQLWRDVIDHLGEISNKIIVPDCLGYAGTDKPTDTRLYAYKDQASDLIEILAAEDVGDADQGFTTTSAILIGHDWGSALAQRVYLHHRHLFSAVILLNTGYMVPSAQAFDLDAVNALTQQLWGYPQFAYWEFFLAPDAAEIIHANLDRMWEVLHGSDTTETNWMKELFCARGAMRAYLLGESRYGKSGVPLKPYARDARRKEEFLQQFADVKAVDASLNMYRAMAANVQLRSDATLLDGNESGNLVVDVPLLFVICERDAVCSREMMTEAKQRGLVPKLREVVLDAAHWSPLERPKDIAQYVRDILERKER